MGLYSESYITTITIIIIITITINKLVTVANYKICTKAKFDRYPKKHVLGETPILSYPGEFFTLIFSKLTRNNVWIKFSKFAIV